MNPTPIKLAQACAAVLLLAGLAGCGERLSDTRAKAPKPLEPSPSAVVIGQAPAESASEAAIPTPAAPSNGTNNTEVTKSVESGVMPQPGQANDHSNVAPLPSQKSGEIAKTVPEGKSANDGERK